MRRGEPFIVIMVLLSLVGGWAAWAFAIPALAHGTHKMSFRSSGGHLAIVLDHDGGELSHHHAHAHDGVTGALATTTTSPPHDHDQAHVVELPGSGDPCSMTAAKSLPHDGGPAIPIAATIGCASLHAPLVSCVARSRAGPSSPSRSSILRI